MRAIGSLILKVSVVILLVIFIGILSMVLSAFFNSLSIMAGAGYTAQYTAYGIFYNNCLNNAEIFGFNSSACNELLNVTESTANSLLWTGKYTGALSNPILWAIIFTIMTAGLYVVSMQGIQLGPNVVVKTTKRKKK